MSDSQVVVKKPSKGVQFFYGLGAMPYGIKDNGFSYFLLIFYSQVLGLPPYAASLALAIAIAIDAVSDPIVGYVSDNWRSKFGRRHPFMYVAMIPICLSYVFLWNPPAEVIADKELLFYYLLALAVLVRILITFFEVPNTALISEFTDDYDMRTGLMGLRYMFGWLGGIGMAMLGYFVFLGDADSLVAEGVVSGYGAYGMMAAGLMFVGMLVSALGTHRTIETLHVPPSRTRPRLADVFRELWETTRNYSFRVLFVASIFSGTAAGLGAAMSVYFNTFYWGLAPQQLGLFSIVHVFSALCALPAAYVLGKKFEKKQAAMGSFFIMIAFGPVMVLARLADLLPPNGSDLLFLLLAVHTFIEVGMIIIFFTLFGAMMADVVEDSAVDTARRSEGVLFAARGFAGKMVSGVGVLIAGLIITAAGLQPSITTPDNVPPDVLRNLVLYTVPVQVLFYGTALYILRYYRITRQKHGRNLAELSQAN
ncbi:MAG: MFS transporter [Alphaproteobacteria bacterium]|nr:MFS transporter [Alphaproteobacteria bacterium]